MHDLMLDNVPDEELPKLLTYFTKLRQESCAYNAPEGAWFLIFAVTNAIADEIARRRLVEAVTAP